MGYYLNGKEVGYAEYIEYLENVILDINENLYDELGLHSNIDEAITIITENKKIKEEALKKEMPRSKS